MNPRQAEAERHEGIPTFPICIWQQKGNGKWQKVPKRGVKDWQHATALIDQFANVVGGVIPIGRVSWLQNGGGGFENFCWIMLANQPAKFLEARSG